MKDGRAGQDIWHLTVDDLFATPAEQAERPRLGGDGPFVINLSTSTAPINIPPKSYLSFERMHVYQITRTEDGRQRFRLRLGPISTELEADAILAAVREIYPSAMTATPADDDLRALSSAARVADAAKAPKVAPKAASKPVAQKASVLPPVVVAEEQDDPNEITGTGWDLDSLLPHLSGPGPAPVPAAKKSAPKKAPIARPPTPAAAAVKSQPVAKAATPPPPVARPPTVAQPAIAAAPPTDTSAPVAQPTPAARHASARPAAKTLVKTATQTPPVLTMPIERPATTKIAPPVVIVAARPVAEPAAPPAVAQSVEPEVQAAVAVETVKAPEPVTEKPPVAAASPTVEVVAPPVVIEVIAPPVAAVVVAPPVYEPPAAIKPIDPPHAAVPRPIFTAVAAEPRVAIDTLTTDPFETDWAAILSAPVHETANVATMQLAVDPRPAPSPVPATAAQTTTDPTASIAAKEDSGLRRLVEKNNALVDSLVTQADTSAQVVEPAPTIAFNPLSTQSIEQKLAKLAEMLHDTQQAAAPIAAPADPPTNLPAVTSTTAPSVESELDPNAQTDCVPVLKVAAAEVEVEISLLDDFKAEPKNETRAYAEIERREEPRPTLKSATDVLSSIEDMIVVDEENNLENIVAKQDATAETGRVPVVAAPPVEDVFVDLSIDEPVAAAPEPAPALELTLAPEPEPTPVPAPALRAPPELMLATELTLVPVEPAPPPKLIEDLVLHEEDFSLAGLVEKSNALVESLEKKAEAHASAMADEATVVPTVVLEDPVPATSAPHVTTVVLDKVPAPAANESSAPVVVRSRETLSENAAKNAAQITARAAARAAKKLRAAKHAAKQAAMMAAATAPAPKGQTPSAKAPTPPTKVPPAHPRTQVTTRKSGTSTGTHEVVATPAAVSASAKNGHATERRVEIRTEHMPSVDSTQTIRALTPLELADDQASKWFVIQLAVSEDDFDPEQIPHLDIFEAYRLYSVIGLDDTKIVHALRLGFFSDEISAQAVHGYLKTHFAAAAVKRVSIAERERFAERQVEARKDIGATGMHAIIEMASPTPVRETRLADLTAANAQPQAEEKSIWSRLVSPLKR